MKYRTDPSSAEYLPDRLNDLNHALQLDEASRSINSASIGEGGLRVKSGGGVNVLPNGIVDVRRGNLLLGDGQIAGNALKSQIEPQSYKSTNSGFGSGTSWGTVASLSVPAGPAWATNGMLMSVSSEYIRLFVDFQMGWWYSIRVGITNGGKTVYSDRVIADWGKYFGRFFQSGQITQYLTIANTATTIFLQGKGDTPNVFGANDENRAEISASVVWTR